MGVRFWGPELWNLETNTYHPFPSLLFLALHLTRRGRRADVAQARRNIVNLLPGDFIGELDVGGAAPNPSNCYVNASRSGLLFATSPSSASGRENMSERAVEPFGIVASWSNRNKLDSVPAVSLGRGPLAARRATLGAGCAAPPAPRQCRGRDHGGSKQVSREHVAEPMRAQVDS